MGNPDHACLHPCETRLGVRIDHHGVENAGLAVYGRS
jgi:hypothetical protein